MTDTTTPLATFLADLNRAFWEGGRACPPVVIVAEIIATGGSLIIPRTGDNWGPALVYLELHGIFATGPTLAEAAECWLRMAIDSQLRAAKLAEAEATIMRPDLCDDETLRAACRLLIDHSPDHLARSRALTLAAVLGSTHPIPA